MDFSSPSRLLISSAPCIGPSSSLLSLPSYTPANSSPPRLPTSERDTSAYSTEEGAEEDNEKDNKEDDEEEDEEDVDFKAAFDCITQNCPQWNYTIR
jgi:hypothetical protein